MDNKICLVLPCNFYAAPYYYQYEKILNKLQLGFDLIIWNRDGIEEKTTGNIISFDVRDIANSGDKKKILKYFEFASFVKKQLLKNEYEKVVFLSTAAGVVALLSLFLKYNYPKKYWVDIRDYSYEAFYPYKVALGIAITNAYASSISSVGFKKFLPEHHYLITHNIDFESIKQWQQKKVVREESLPVRISFIGNIRYFDLNKKMLEIFKNDDRFLLQYYGKQSEILSEFCRAEQICNVDFFGRFDVEKTAQFYAKTDIINNVYGNDRLELTTALSNKLYYAASLHIPILVSSNTFMEKVSKEYNFGYTMDLDDPNANDKLFDWYMNRTERTCRYEEFMEQVIKEFNDCEDQLIRFLKSN